VKVLAKKKIKFKKVVVVKPFSSCPLLNMKAFWRIFALQVLHSELIDEGSLDLNS